MNERLSALRQSVRDREHNKYRQLSAPDVQAECEREGLSWPKRAARLVHRMCEAEKVVIAPEDKIVYMQTIPSIPRIYSETGEPQYHPLNTINNICADWEMTLTQGLLGRRKVALETRARMLGDSNAVEFLDCAVETIDAVLELTKRYAEGARNIGRDDLATILDRVPANPPRTFHEALQFMRLVHGTLWLGGHYHVGLGRFDQYMWPYLKADMESGQLAEQEAEDLLAEFFISLNKDTDLYYGVQQGDNGQSLMLGGVKRDGTNAVNPLTYMVLRVSKDVGMIDPKINLRINSNTDMDLLYRATELTRKGLGFPQYANDDVVIPSLVDYGYDIEDARDYTVAACWEFIIPGKGLEAVNYGWLSFPAAADHGIREGLAENDNFTGIMEHVSENIAQRVDYYVQCWKNHFLPPAPYYSVLMDGCLESGRDLSNGIKYNSIGIHGACSSDAADALAAVKKLVLDERKIEPETLIKALDANFVGYEELQSMLKEAPKVGDNDDEADAILVKLYDLFADACESHHDKNGKRCVRPGAGSAQLYIEIAKLSGATANGRKENEPFSANLAPSPCAKPRGPISVLQSFSKIDYGRICNGGPITMELSDAVFRDEESIRKVAMLVRTFAKIGCQQLQLNALNFEKLIDAKAHPDKHRDLIVRVWGWSGYFCELAPEYQDHVIARHQYAQT